MTPQTNKISSIKTKRYPKLKQKKTKTGAATRFEFFLKYLALDVPLKFPTSTRHCILLIDIISNGNPYERTLITIVNVKSANIFRIITTAFILTMSLFCKIIKQN